MRYFLWLVLWMPFFVIGQSIELREIDIYYGEEVIRSQHQVVESSPEEVSIIPVERQEKKLDQHIVLGGSGSVSYVEEGKIAEREQAIYEEVNKRTKESPFTVLFTGHIPEEIQEKRLRVMPDFGLREKADDTDVSAEDVFGGSGASSSESSSTEAPDVGSFAPIGRDTPSGTN
ncbi:hypothetical protein OFY17_05590 [Marinomonas sp. C2222]|uniref:Uncharacterized protein n=1 Tax=Marinomonas sargassi TaxID=2984494 RepID=A0ABT2YRS7_9GAMM|nr:hypothetical protein [Marinomonas sargassi]MCV2402359.1 hypothetical protein [Marinomonas sargassi]